MKNFLLILILVFLGLYYFVPYQNKVVLLEKVGIDSSIISFMEEKMDMEKGKLVEMRFDTKTNKTSFNGDISFGKILPDLSWGNQTYVQCFLAGKNNYFNGNTVLHRTVIGKNKNISVKLNSENKNLSIFVYKTDALSKIFPPEINYVFDCKNDISLNNEVLIDMKGNTAPSDIVIGVAGANGVLEGKYSLELEEK